MRAALNQFSQELGDTFQVLCCGARPWKLPQLALSVSNALSNRCRGNWLVNIRTLARARSIHPRIYRARPRIAATAPRERGARSPQSNNRTSRNLTYSVDGTC